MRCFEERLFNNNMELVDIFLEDNAYIYVYIDEDGYYHYVLLQRFKNSLDD